MEAEAAKPQADGAAPEALNPARNMSLHLLRMLETRLEVAGMVLQSETQRVVSRLQLHMLAAAAVFIALWGGIVLLAIALPDHWRVPVLSCVVGAFVLTALWAFFRAKRMISGHDVGSTAWFLDGLKLDLEVLARSLGQSQPASHSTPEPQRDPPSDIAA